MTDEFISPLRRRMIEDMTIRKSAPKTQMGYIRHIKNFTTFLGRSPDSASADDLRRFQLHQRQNGVQSSSMNSAVSQAFAAFVAPLRQTEWVVYAKRPFGGPQAVLAYLSRYTHRVAIANSRLLALDGKSVTFKWKDYRSKGSNRYKAMTLAIDKFIRRFLIHVLPRGFHRIRHYGLFARPSCGDNIARARQMLAASQDEIVSADAKKLEHTNCCPCCGGRMIIIERFKRGATPRHQPTAQTVSIRIDTS